MLVVHGLRRAYGSRRVLDCVDLTAGPGEIVALLGPNGAGKTTLVSILAGLRRPDAGSVVIGGIDALGDPRRVRGQIGLAPQELGIYPVLSVERNLALFGELGGLSGRALRRRVAEVADALELTPLLRQRASTLSGGQQRRLHAGMAIVHAPRLLFLDEPTVGADVRSRGQILDLVRTLAAGGTTTIYTTHYLAEIEELDAGVAVLHHGRIVARGSASELVAAHAHPRLRLAFTGTAPELAGFEHDGSVATLQTPDPARAAAAVLPRLGPAAARLSGIDIVRPSLEAAYLALTAKPADASSGQRDGVLDALVA